MKQVMTTRETNGGWTDRSARASLITAAHEPDGRRVDTVDDEQDRRRPGAPDQQAQDDLGRRLIARVGAGDRQALADLYARYRQPLFQYLAQLTPDYGLAEELLQDTLVAVWRSAGDFAGRSSALTWLIGVARRQAHNTLRQRGLVLADEATLLTLAAPDPDPADAALASAAHADLLAAIGRLGVVHREALTLAFVHGLAYQELADVLGVPIGTVKSRLNHARRALRAELARAPQSQPLAPPGAPTMPGAPSAPASTARRSGPTFVNGNPHDDVSNTASDRDEEARP